MLSVSYRGMLSDAKEVLTEDMSHSRSTRSTQIRLRARKADGISSLENRILLFGLIDTWEHLDPYINADRRLCWVWLLVTCAIQLFSPRSPRNMLAWTRCACGSDCLTLNLDVLHLLGACFRLRDHRRDSMAVFRGCLAVCIVALHPAPANCPLAARCRRNSTHPLCRSAPYPKSRRCQSSRGLVIKGSA